MGNICVVLQWKIKNSIFCFADSYRSVLNFDIYRNGIRRATCAARKCNPFSAVNESKSHLGGTAVKYGNCSAEHSRLKFLFRPSFGVLCFTIIAVITGNFATNKTWKFRIDNVYDIKWFRLFTRLIFVGIMSRLICGSLFDLKYI